jgi:hypothetical protein
MLEKLMPKSDEFFDDFDKQATASVEGTRLLLALLTDFTDVAAKARGIKDVEHQGDEHTHTAFARLHKQFITPFDRSEIHDLLSRIDDVLDLSDAAAERLSLYDVQSVPEDALALTGVLVKAAQRMKEAVALLRDVKKHEPILAACKDIKLLEKEADTFLRAGLAKLFRSGTDPLTVIKWKEIYELIESAVDACDDVANVVEGVVLEHS